ncbi:ATP-binding protein [Nitrosomonas sp.]|nr:ATP-binding protein [Nitrosomonas sp.]
MIIAEEVDPIFWTVVLGSERLTSALLDRLTHHAHILKINGESYRLAAR